MIVVEDVRYQYAAVTNPALDGVSLTIEAGESVSVIGPNGSGKSTLARCLNGLILPTEGRVAIDGMDTKDDAQSWEIFRQVGMVFQNPDNQLVSTTVERELAFGLENIGLPTSEIHDRVSWALDRFHLADYRLFPPHRLSGGEKQRLAIAAVTAMHPRYLVCDEPTALLDPGSRDDILSLILSLRQEYGMGVIYITQYPDEAALMDRTVLMAEGRLEADGPPAVVFRDAEKLDRHGLEAPLPIRLAEALCVRQLDVPADIARTDELVCHISRWTPATGSSERADATVTTPAVDDRSPAVELQKIRYTYSPDTILASPALRDISVRLYPGECVALVGPNGSGKSTFIQHLNRLLTPDSGTILINGTALSDRPADLHHARRKVGLIFQFPEAQLFEDSVFDDVAFGPRNMGIPESEMKARVHQALTRVHLDPDRFSPRHPFSLSGGEKRRAAIAGVLAMEPDILALDEPTAGLDPKGVRQMETIFRLYRDTGAAIILISHDMDLVARLSDRILVLDDGRIIADETPRNLFIDHPDLPALPIEKPALCSLLEDIRSAGIPVEGCFDVDEAADRIRASVAGGM